jgi:hypothetical protein
MKSVKPIISYFNLIMIKWFNLAGYLVELNHFIFCNFAVW